MNATPLVSILINNYNYAPFLTQAVDSALRQTYENIEVIVVDDGSTDNSWQVIKSYGDRIVPIAKKNGGQASAFNAGFEKSQGDIVCFLDSDDVFLPDKLQKLVDIFDRYREVGWCFHPLERVDNDLKQYLAPEQYSGAPGPYDLRKLLRRGKLGEAMPFKSIVTSGMCFRRELLEKILPMPLEIRITSDDYIKYAALGVSKGYILLENLALQRIHPSNAYTFRDDRPLLRAKILLQTAYFLRRDFPEIKAYANNLFSLGAAEFLQQSQKDDQQLHRLVKDYYASLSFLERIKVKLRERYYLGRKR
ncbi:glycosyltransferase family 2 protein [Leptolyngbya sp. BC1307]|uniref:glycosyltransferase family 2 protein n=1 Tax=Leptolyngbya sp. BC1307 TaxID=2029589 RepID=UPI000EFA64E1|nr:glycosyltransferase family 2 protein [Leptolyngbya sp. BC1307]